MRRLQKMAQSRPCHPEPVRLRSGQAARGIWTGIGRMRDLWPDLSTPLRSAQDDKMRGRRRLRMRDSLLGLLSIALPTNSGGAGSNLKRSMFGDGGKVRRMDGQPIPVPWNHPQACTSLRLEAAARRDCQDGRWNRHRPGTYPSPSICHNLTCKHCHRSGTPIAPLWTDSRSKPFWTGMRKGNRQMRNQPLWSRTT